eukprot:5580883-Pyramimonas_sp.AAC.1
MDVPRGAVSDLYEYRPAVFEWAVDTSPVSVVVTGDAVAKRLFTAVVFTQEGLAAPLLPEQ